jgi:hypothetical protein
MKGRKDLLPAAVLTAFPLILYAPFLLGKEVLYWGVYLLQFYPWRQLAVEQIRAGHWPLWNPYLGAGTPLAANLQTAAFYPPNLLFLLMPVEQAFAWELALHVALAGLCAYYLGRALGLSPFGALIGGLAYGGGGYVVAHWVFPSMVYAAAWLPLMLALAERTIRRARPNTQYPIANNRDRILGIGSLALVIALQLLAGHAQTSFYSAVIVACFSLVRLLQRGEGSRGEHIRGQAVAAGSLLLAALWGLALAAIQLLPTAELVAHSQRAGALTDLRFALELSFWPWRIIGLLAPDFFGNPARDGYWAYGTYWEEATFVGVLPLILAALALAGWWRGRKDGTQGAIPSKPTSWVPFFSLLALLSLLLALGDHTPLYPLLFRYIPGFGLFQAPARLMIGYALGVAMLAGIGAETLRLPPRTRTALRVLALLGLGIAAAGAFARLALPDIRTSFGSSVFRLGATLALASGVLLLRARRLRGKRWEALVAGLIAADLLAFGWGLAPGTAPSVYHTPVASAEFLQAQPPGRIHVAEPYTEQVYDQYVSLGSFGSTDPDYLQGLRESLHPNLNSIHHLLGTGNYDPLTVAWYRDLADLLEGDPGAPSNPEQVRRLLNLFGVRYIVTEKEWDLPLIYDGGPQIYHDLQALPEVFVVEQMRVVEDDAARLETLLDPAFHPHTEVLLSRAPALPLPEPALDTGEDSPSQPDPLLLRRDPDRLVILADMTQPGYLVLTDTYYPGWQATVDGEPTEILPANHAFRAVELSAGDHTIIFEYAPLSFRLGAWITLGAASLLAIVLIAAGLQSRRAR